jgi:hypothetical protein
VLSAISTASGVAALDGSAAAEFYAASVVTAAAAKEMNLIADLR